MVRGLSPSIDLLVSTTDGSRSISIQVKTARKAHRTFSGKRRNNRSEWEVSWPLKGKPSRAFFYSFVDLQEGSRRSPEIFIVPSLELQRVMGRINPGVRGWRRPFVWIMDDPHSVKHEEDWRRQWRKINRRKYLDNHRLLTEAMAGD